MTNYYPSPQIRQAILTLLCCWLICLLVQTATAQYYLGDDRKKSVATILKKYPLPDWKITVTESDTAMHIWASKGPRQPHGYTVFFNGREVCTAFRNSYNCDSCMRKGLRYVLVKEKEGWQPFGTSHYISRYKKQMVLTVGNDTDTYFFTLYKMDWDRDEYEAAMADSSVDITGWIAQHRYEPTAYRPDTALFKIWHGGQRLTWADFEEQVQYDKYPRVRAKVACGLQYGLGNRSTTAETIILPVFVYAVMVPKHSWMRKENIGKRDILVHEQLHFDIIELGARQLRQQLLLGGLRKDGYSKGLRKLVRAQWKATQSMQEKFDEAVRDDVHHAKLAQWLADIAEKLHLLEAYAEPEVKVSLW